MPTSFPGFLGLALMSALSLLGGCRGGAGPVCEPGTAGCSCEVADECGGALSCLGGVCESEGCVDGLEGCPCGAGCGAGLSCNAVGYCVRGTGGLGEACYSNRTCDAGYLCGAGEICQSCTPGSLGCDCFANETCNGGLTCMSKRCSGSGGEPTVPKTIQCFTPCQQSFVDATGEFRACPVDGLMRGCVDGATCERGSCVTGADLPRVCSEDVDCPDFQACIYGECLANCDYDADCAAHERCYRHACRVPCSSSSADGCDEGSECELTDAEFGFCTPMSAPAAGLPEEVPEGEVGLSTRVLSLTNVAPNALITVVNGAPRSVDFTLRRARHFVGGEEVSTLALPWLAMGLEEDGPGFEDELSFRVPAGKSGKIVIEVDDAALGEIPSRWTGQLVLSSELGEQTIDVGYASTPDGRWVGQAYYFTQFSDIGLAAYVSGGAPVTSAKNALVQRFADFRSSNLGRKSWSALLTSVLEETWAWPSVEEACSGGRACYPFVGNAVTGLETLIQEPATDPIPRGVVALPVALNLRAMGDGLMEGRFVSSDALHYAGDPRVTITQDASTCAPESDCRIRVRSLDATIAVGGRYAIDAEEACPTDFLTWQTPWLVPAFERGTGLDTASGSRFRKECRNAAGPFDPSGSGATQNAALSRANPIPDGQTRSRELALIDGVLVDQEVYYLLFKESFSDSFLGDGAPGALAAYGVMVLRRGNATLQPKDYVGNEHSVSDPTVTPRLAAACEDSLAPYAQRAGTEVWPIASNTVGDAVRMLLDGVPAGEPVAVDSPEVHYLCHDTGLFDQGPNPSIRRVACPAGSAVTYFSCAESFCPGQLESFSCQDSGTCGELLDDWRAGALPVSAGLELDLIPVCSDRTVPTCDLDRYDLVSGKTFFAQPEANAGAGEVQVVFAPLRAAVVDAFRYKTQFQSRNGGSLGFAPEPCVSGSNEIPYCYDAAEIERLRDRLGCLVAVATHATLPAGLDPETAVRLREALRFHLGYESDPSGVQVVTEDGFERLYAELMVMLGDDAYTAAFRSRYDLAGSTLVSFEGAQFEPNGMNLSGVAGYELFTLYRAVQYYDLALDRFFSLAPHLSGSLALGESEDFVTPETVTGYLARVLRASTQRARAYSEIATRYQRLMRSDLASGVVERAYTAAYLESIVLGRLMERIAEQTSPTDGRAALLLDLEQSAVAYRMALLEMRDIYAKLGGDLNYFGFSPDYIPLPAPETGGANSFELLLSRARQSTQVAAQREELAISSNRAYETDAVAFQGELVRIRNSYDNQLGELCGTFWGADGQPYPSTPKYAYLDATAALLGNPCGLMGTGRLYQAIGAVDLQNLALRDASMAISNLLESMTLEEQSVEDLCDAQNVFAQATYESREGQRSIQEDIGVAQNVIANANAAVQTAATVAKLTKCVLPGAASGGDCATSLTAGIAFAAAESAATTARLAAEVKITKLQSEISAMQNEEIFFSADLQCDQWNINSAKTLANMTLELKRLQLAVLKAQKQVELAMAEVKSLYSQAVRLMAEQGETEQLAINLEAAKNDPNVRIYRNDAILNAEWAFDAALSDAYRATKAYEYYASQSYAPFDKLRLARLAARGDYNLENYLAELEDAYEAFTESYGRPDQRVDVLSVRDDILRIPMLDAAGALSINERVDEFRVTLSDPKWRDGNGRIVLPFSTSTGRLSPLTRNHKVDYIEVEIVGSKVGDAVGRVYLRQTGTGMLSRLGGGESFYRFPTRTAVINAFFNGVRSFDARVYRSEQLRDRPYVGSGWEVIFDQRGEWANRDITLSSLTDIRIYVHYTDFTEL